MIFTNVLTAVRKLEVFCFDISKAFGNVWHDGIIFKLEQNGISGKLHKNLHDFLVNRNKGWY